MRSRVDIFGRGCDFLGVVEIFSGGVEIFSEGLRLYPGGVENFFGEGGLRNIEAVETFSSCVTVCEIFRGVKKYSGG